ncbi:hypothetical protein BDFB_015099 [Asbolus verrucosus]|uniref:DDE 3 domain containing protein n=1 Tax=Asbolus verrucosus TaxID=1661398 RepID=A0A482VXM3_ASBVE|nr:hypothetical protein BDFB_015099 [Asbolus verrucosus]
MRLWSSENSHIFTERPLHPRKNWCLDRTRTLTAVTYREEILLLFINQLHDDELKFGYFQQDGAISHSAQDT